MSLQPGLYELQSTTNQLWAGLGIIQLSDPPPPTPLKGLEYEMKVLYLVIYTKSDK
jgi:hypothetical protein